jgi:hypothetical protein
MRSEYKVRSLRKTSSFKQQQQHQRLTWELLKRLEPRLAELYEKARSIKDDHSRLAFCANWHWYGLGEHWPGGLSAQVSRLVGWSAKHPDPRLHTSAAYDIAYHTIYNALPDCRNCCCPDLRAIKLLLLKAPTSKNASSISHSGHGGA